MHEQSLFWLLLLSCVCCLLADVRAPVCWTLLCSADVDMAAAAAGVCYVLFCCHPPDAQHAIIGTSSGQQ
jgi:hypothetical protein